MHPRIVTLAVTGVAADLLCFVAAAAILLTNNMWLTEIGPARFWFVVMLVGIGLVPMMYAFERDAVARKLDNTPEKLSGDLPPWAGMDRSVRTA